MSVPPRKFAALLVSATIAVLCASCRDDVDLQMEQAILLETEAPKKPVTFQPDRDLERAPDVFRVKFRVKHAGNFVIEVHRDWAPHSADRFYNMTRAGYWKGNQFFRVIRGHMVQWGIHPRPRVTRSWQKKPIVLDRATRSNLAGYVAFNYDLEDQTKRVMSTQVFVNLSDHPAYDRYCAPFGRVVEGFDAFSRINSLPGEIAENGNEEGINSVEAAKKGGGYVKKLFPSISWIRSAVLLEP